MKRDTTYSNFNTRISRRDKLPLLRGMFVSPEAAGRKQKSYYRSIGTVSISEDELILTADKGSFLGV